MRPAEPFPFNRPLRFRPHGATLMPISTKPPVCNGMMGFLDHAAPCNEMIPPGARRLLAERVFPLTWFWVKPF